MWWMQEYVCPDGHRTESLVPRERKPRSVPCLCGLRAVRAVSAVKSKTVWGSAAVRGKSDPPPAPTAMDAVGTVGESKSLSEWRKARSAMWRERDRQKRRAKGAPA